jgi:hypothetical protein
MSRHSLVLILLLGSLVASTRAYAQLTPPAGTAGAGNTPINGIPFGPANPSAASDPSGLLNASKIPPLHANPPVQSPPPQVVYAPAGSSRSRVTTPYASQRVFSADEIDSRRPPVRRRGRTKISKFTGICRGC